MLCFIICKNHLTLSCFLLYSMFQCVVWSYTLKALLGKQVSLQEWKMYTTYVCDAFLMTLQVCQYVIIDVYIRYNTWHVYLCRHFLGLYTFHYLRPAIAHARMFYCYSCVYRMLNKMLYNSLNKLLFTQRSILMMNLCTSIINSRCVMLLFGLESL